MATSIKQRLNAIPDKRAAKEIKAILDAILVDLTALRTTVAALVTDNGTRISDHNTLRAKLNADAGVTDTNYAAATAATATAPSAITTQS